MDLFGRASTWLSTQLGVGAIDWAALAAAGQPGVYNTAYIQEYMAPAFSQAAVTMASLDLHPGTTSEVLADYYLVQSKIGPIADKVLVGTGNAIEAMTPVTSPTLMWSTINNVLYYMWAVGFTGFQSHLTGAIQRTDIAPGDIAYHASIITMMFNLLVKLDALGVLKPFKKDTTAQSTSGLGIAPALLVALVVLGIALIVALAWGVTAIYESSRINARIDAACTKAIQTGSAQDQAMCQQLQASSTPLSNTIPNAVSGVIEKISIFAMVGAGLYLAVQFGPGIATKLKQSVSAWNSA